jgi:peptidyl-prolyl cis-trans isomerase D
MRKHSKSWLGWILAGFLIILFAAWGIGDMLQQSLNPQRPVIVVNGEEVSGQEFDTAYRRLQERVAQATGQQIDYARAKELGIVQQTIDGLVTERLVAQELRKRGLLISDNVIRAEIAAMPELRGTDGRFSPALFRAFLQNAGIGEAAYVASRKGELARSYLVSGIAAVEAAPGAMAKRLDVYRNEGRAAEVLTVQASPLKAPEPTAADIEAYYKANPARYTAPEFRVVTLVHFSAADAAERIEIKPEEIAREYQTRRGRGEYTTPEKRRVQYLLLPTEAAAREAYAALSGGRTFQSVADDVVKRKPVDLGKVAKADIPLTELREPVFKLKQGEVTEPIRSGLGWAIAHVDEIEAEVIKPQAEVEKDLVALMKRQRATPLIAHLKEQFDDALAGGAKIDAAAEKLKIKVTKISAIDARGADEAGAKVAGLPTDDDFLRRLFRQAKGEEGEIVDLRSNGFYIARVDEIRASHVRPLESVRARVAADWQQAERMKLAKGEAEKLAVAARGGKSLEELAKEGGHTVRKTQAQRRGATPAAPGSLEEAIFAGKPGEIVAVAQEGAWAVAKIEIVKDEQPEAASKAARERFLDELKRAYEADIVDSYARDLRAKASVRVDQAAIDRQFSQNR